MVKRDLHALILTLLGATLLQLALTGGYTRYVKPGMRPFLIAGAVVVLAVAIASLAQGRLGRRARWTPTAPDPARHPDGSHDATRGSSPQHTAGDGHAHGGPDVAWLLLAPMLAVLLLAPPALGSYSAARSGTALGAASTSTLPPLPDGDPVRLSLLDYASRAVFDNGRSLTGRQLTMSGFLVANPTSGWYLTRMVITCCAADAQPIKVGLTGSLPGGLHASDWLQVTGAYTPRTDTDPVNTEPIPYLNVTAAQPIPAPARQYES
jgi:uncharacterized repeat protein (TIGR03943 family)